MFIKSGCSSVGRASAFQAEGRGFESRRPLHFSKKGFHPLFAFRYRFTDYPHRGMCLARSESDARHFIALLETATCQEGFRGKGRFSPLTKGELERVFRLNFSPRSGEREQGAKRPPKGNCEKRPNIKKNIFVNFFAARVAQSVERILGKDEVTSSILVAGSTGDFKQ